MSMHSPLVNEGTPMEDLKRFAAQLLEGDFSKSDIDLIVQLVESDKPYNEKDVRSTLATLGELLTYISKRTLGEDE